PPSQVISSGRAAPCRKAGLESRIVGGAEGARTSAFFPPPHPPSAVNTSVAEAAHLTALRFNSPVAFHACKGEVRDACTHEQDCWTAAGADRRGASVLRAAGAAGARAAEGIRGRTRDGRSGRWAGHRDHLLGH